MKKDIHPKVNKEAIVTCVCGNKFTTISTLSTLQVDVCNNCHPFFTGQQKFLDTEGRIDKFNKKAKQMESEVQKHKATKEAKKAKKSTTEPTKKPNLKELLEQMKTEEAQTNISQTNQ